MLRWLNELPSEQAQEQFARCCGAHRWVEAIASRRPFADVAALLRASDEIWQQMGEADWLEAFAHHPQIGASRALPAGGSNDSASSDWASKEQAQVASAEDATKAKLADGNAAYHAKFGFIFIVCATGKSATEMLALLEGRLAHSRSQELVIAAGEQNKITRLRLEKLMAQNLTPPQPTSPISPITTHVLDVAQGRPAAGVSVSFERHNGASWQMIAQRTTDQDGRVRDLLEPGTLLRGRYRLTFDVGGYLGQAPTFYSEIPIVFDVADPNQHYHVPLLLSPFGYSTYRGS